MTNALYDEDIVAWAEQQAASLRVLAQRRPDLSNLLDWDNLAEEMDSLGRTEVRLFTSPLKQFLIHLAKALSAPESRALPHWRTEAIGFHDDAVGAYLPSMRQKVDLDDLWRVSVRQARLALAEHDDALASDIPVSCPLTLDELLQPALDLDTAVDLAATRIGRP